MDDHEHASGEAGERRPERDTEGKLGLHRSGVTRSGSKEQEEAALAFAIESARSLHDDKCADVLVLDVRGRSQLTDFIVIASGTSDRQMRASGQHVDALGRERSFSLHRDNLRESEPSWIVLDFVDVVVHVFEPQTRLYYDLEMLWGDAERVSWARAGDDPIESSVGRNRAGLSPDDVLER